MTIMQSVVGLAVVGAFLFTLVSVEARQYFIEKPSDVPVLKGKTAKLKCVIGDRKGQVQWTKGGNSLGFNRTIPGKPRYEVTGSLTGLRDEFNLKISNVQLSDDDEYSCQVLPAEGDGYLIAKASLTVMVPSEAPYIKNYANGSKVEALYTDSSLMLECIAENGRPAADIQWFRNGLRVMENIEYSSTPIEGTKLLSAQSKLTISLSDYRQKNGNEYRCEATNSYWLDPVSPTMVTLNIFYPPGPPQISGYDGRTLTVNSNLDLTCISRGGNPVGQVEWYRNGSPVKRNHAATGTAATNNFSFRVQASDHKARYTCKVSSTSPNMASQNQSYVLSVYFPPERVTMQGANSPVMQNHDVTLTCTTAPANPAATIYWYNGQSMETSTLKIITSQETMPNGAVVTTSSYTFKALSRYHNRVITCRAENGQSLGQSPEHVTATRTLNVYYPPSNLSITGYTAGTSLRAGEYKKLDCVATGGNPVANLQWFKGNRLLDHNITNYPVYQNHLAMSQYLLDVKPSDNGAVYKCKASNNATSSPLVAQVRLSVNFPPESVSIMVSPETARVGDQVSLVCSCSSSNPPAEITWTRNKRRMSGTNLVHEPAAHGGKESTNRLIFRASARDHNSVYGCVASNLITGQSVIDAVTLNVKFKPQFDVATLPSTVEMRNGQRSRINLTAIANPQVVSYQLFKDGIAMNPLPDHFNMSAGVLTISKVEKTDKGSYVVKATNAEGSTEFNFLVVVKYEATISRISPVQSVDEGTDVVFVCEADAYPVIPKMFTWFREGFDLSRFIEKQEGQISTLTVRHLKREDAGKFKCTVDNRIGSPNHRSASLVVKFSPVIDKSPEMSRSAGRPGTDVTIWCNADGAPHVDITWTRNNTQVRPNSKFEVNTTKVGAQYKSKLKIKSITSDDYGAYVCTATNSKGSDSHSIALAGTTKPYPPYLIHVVNKTARSITIAWKAGFNGGLSQSFRIRYKPVEASGYVFRDVAPYGALSYKLTGLQLDVEYEITVLAFNEKGKSAYPVPGITVTTLDKEMPADVMTSDLQGSDETPVIIILVVCIVGVFILTLNVGLILFFIRKRKKRLEGSSDTTSHTNTFELYGSANKGDPNLYPPPPSDDTRSYGTYDKSMDDFSDDYIRDYDSDYPGSRPYSPSQKLAPADSPRLLGGGHKMTTYIAEEKPGRISPWTEDPYKRATPTYRKGSYENGIQNGDVYEFKSARGKGMNELSDRPSHRPPSRSGSSSVLSPNIVANPSYNGPVSSFSSSNGGINNHGGPSTTIASINHHHHPSSSSRASPSPYKANNYTSSSSIHRPPPSPHNTMPVGSEFRGHLV